MDETRIYQNMIWEKEFLKVVKIEFEKKKQRNPRFSIRQYATKLGLSIGALSELLSGKRRLTRERALKIVEKLDLTEDQKLRLYVLMGEQSETAESALVPSDELHDLQGIIKDWRNFVILSILFHPDLASALPGVLSATGLSEEEVLSRLAFFKTKFPTESHLVSFQIDPLQKNQQIFSGESLSNFRANQIEVIKRSFEKQDPQQLFYSLTLYASKEKYDKICKELRQTLLNLLTVEPEANSERLFQISMQLFSYDKQNP